MLKQFIDARSQGVVELVYSVAILLALICALVFLDRSLFCECAIFLLWVGDANGSDTSQHIFDPYSFSHFQHGLLFFFLFSLFAKPKLHWAVLLESLWEFLENTPLVIERYRSATAALGYTGDSILNSTFDVICCVLGFYFARKISWKFSLLIYVLIEVLMLLVYRDSLALNIIMLIYPLDFLKDWQTGIANP